MAMTRMSAAVSALCLSAGMTCAQETGSEATVYPVVLTPTRLKQSVQDVPASVTVLTAAMLERFGITTIVDALRLVPGMHVTEATGNDIRVNYHGTNLLLPRRMNVLIDGVSVYQPAFSRVDWSSLPVVLEDVDRIEVTRGPSSAAYGPNSMLSVVNIITKHPGDVGRATGSLLVGSNSALIATGRAGFALGDTEARLTLSRSRDGGYDSLSRAEGGADRTELSRLGLRASTKLGSTANLDTSIAYTRGNRQIPFVVSSQVTNPEQDVEYFYATSTLTKSFSPTHELKVQASHYLTAIEHRWVSCVPTALLLPELFELYRVNPAYANALASRQPYTGGTPAENALALAFARSVAALGPRALQPTCGTPNQNLRETRTQLEVQDTIVLSDHVRAVFGLGGRWHVGDSQTFLDGRVSTSTWWALSNVEYKPRPWLGFNVGGYLEHTNLNDETTFSPRLAANVRLSDKQTVRFAWSRGTRSSDIQEQRADWTYTTYDSSPPLFGSPVTRFYQSGRSMSQLRSERIRSLELGYLLLVPELGLLFDAKTFDDRLTDLISEKLELATFAPTNRGSVKLRGVELQSTAQLSSAWSLFGNYAFLSNRDASNINERSQFSRHSGSVGVANRLGNAWSWAAAYYGASGDGEGESSYGRADLNVSKAFQLGESRAVAQIGVRRLDRKTTTYFRDVGSVLASTHDDRFSVFGQLKISY